MTFKKWAWDLFETTGNLEAFLAMKEAEKQEQKNTFGKMEMADMEFGKIHLGNNEAQEKNQK